MCEEQLAGQMSIFDFLEPAGSALDDLPESEMVRQIADATGLDFRFIDGFWGWKAEVKKVSFYVHYSNYNMDGINDRYIGVGWHTTTQGASGPCDSLQEAIEFFKAAKKRAEGG